MKTFAPYQPRRSAAVVFGFMLWGALWTYHGGPAGFLVDVAREGRIAIDTIIHTGLTLEVGHVDPGKSGDGVGVRIGLSADR